MVNTDPFRRDLRESITQINSTLKHIIKIKHSDPSKIM